LNYTEFLDDAIYNYKNLPDEKNELYKKNYIIIPKEYLFDNKKENESGNTKKTAEGILNKLKEKMNLDFDIYMYNGNVYGSHPSVEINEMSALNEQYISSKLYKSSEEKLAALVNSESQKIIRINVKKGKEDIKLLFVNSSKHMFAQIMCNVESDAELNLFEMFISEAESETLLGVINEMILENGSKADVIMLHDENDKTAVINLHKAELGEKSKLNQHHIYSGGQYVIGKGTVTLLENSAECDINEMLLETLQQKADITTELINSSKNSLALLESKAIIADYAKCIIKGFVHVKEGASGSCSFVNEKGLFIDKTAKIESIPGMSVDEYDVKATHSSSTSPLDEDAMFYILSRGIDEIAANILLLDGFFGKGINKIKDSNIKNAVAFIMHDKIINKKYGSILDIKNQHQLLLDGNENKEKLIQEHYKYRAFKEII
jgi:Fe-S cluster assembly protein SufB/Fe-S cluster assembly protein SufD